MGVGGQHHAPAILPPGKDFVPVVQEAGWAPGPVWTGEEILALTGNRSPDRPARSESLYRLSYPSQTSSCEERQITSQNFTFCHNTRISETLSHATTRMMGDLLCEINSQTYSKQHGLTDAFRHPTLQSSEYDSRT